MIPIGTSTAISGSAIFGCLLVTGQFAYYLKYFEKCQDLAHKGNVKAARELLLPCYVLLFRGMIYIYIIFAICLSWTLIARDVSVRLRFSTIQYFSYTLMVIYTAILTLFLQQYISVNVFVKTAIYLSPWWAICTMLWILGFKGVILDDTTVVDIVFIIISCVPPLLLVYCLSTKKIVSRIDSHSASFQSAIFFLVVYVFLFSINNILYDVLSAKDIDRNDDLSQVVMSFLLIFTNFAWNLLFPTFILPLLKHDTHFWLGIGKNRGIEASSALSNNNEVDMKMASVKLQDMMTRIGDNMIDFSFLQRGSQIGNGGTSRVYEALYRKKAVAIKVCTPTSLSDEVINAFIDETRIMVDLDHRNVLKFYGICVSPPQIGLVVELCSHGDLKTSLKVEKAYWNPQRKIRVCLECAMAISYLHQHNIIHRDVKCHNFFVDTNYTAKLGDFGESTFKIDSANRNMTILGTVAYMAPELIAANKHYSAAIDIYALAVTMCEIWTGDDPFSDVKNFMFIYDLVKEGKRPSLPSNAPEGLNAVIESAWCQDPEKRLSADVMVVRILKILLTALTVNGQLLDFEFVATMTAAANQQNKRDSSNKMFGMLDSIKNVFSTSFQCVRSFGDRDPDMRETSFDRDSRNSGASEWTPDERTSHNIWKNVDSLHAPPSDMKDEDVENPIHVEG